MGIFTDRLFKRMSWKELEIQNQWLMAHNKELEECISHWLDLPNTSHKELMKAIEDQRIVKNLLKLIEAIQEAGCGDHYADFYTITGYHPLRLNCSPKVSP